MSQSLRGISNLWRHALLFSLLVMIFSEITTFNPLSVLVGVQVGVPPQKLISFDPICFDLWSICQFSLKNKNLQK